MAENNKVQIDLLVNTAESAKSVSDIKRSLKDLKAAALEFGEGSEGFKKATAAAGQLNDKLADVNGSIKVLSGNTTENLTRSFSGVAQAGVGGFQAVIGAQALFGEKNKDLQEQLVKLQGVMNFANGIKELANIGQAAKDFKLVLLTLIGAKTTETAVTETNTIVTTQNVASKEASSIASTALAIQNGIAAAATTVLTTITTAFGVASGVAWAIATGGIILLVAAIVGLIVYFDDIKEKVESFGIAGEIALGLILGPLYLLYEGLKTLGEYFGVLDTEAEKSAEKRAEAEEKYKDKIEENYRKISAAQRQADVESGKITQANADRQEAKETFITNFKKAQIDARLAYDKSAGKEEDAVIKKNLDLQIKAISLEYTNKLGEIRKGEKKLADDAEKATEEKNNKIAEKNRASGEKAQKAKEEQAQKLKQLELKYIDETEYEKINRLEKAELEIANKLNASEETKKNIRESYRKQAQDLFDKQMDAEINAMVATNEAEQKAIDEKKAKDDAKLERLKTYQQSVRDIEIAGMSEKDAALAEAEDTRKAERKQLEDEYNALTEEEKIAKKQEFEGALLQIDQEAADKSVVINNEAAEKKKAKDKEYFDAAVKFAGDMAAGLTSLNDLVTTQKTKGLVKGSKEEQKYAKEGFERGKKIAIAQAVISGIAGIVNVMTAKSAFPEPFGMIAKVASSVALGITTAANIAKIKATQFNATAAPSTDTGPAPAAAPPGAVEGGNQAPVGLPTFNLTGQQIGGASNMLGNQNTTGGQQPVKVFVSETDISSVQGKVNVIQGNSLFGG
jgi:hypothetical protein